MKQYGLFFVLALVSITTCLPPEAAEAQTRRTRQVVIPEEDRFTPFVLRIGVGDSVRWINNDSDDHTVVSVDVFTNTNNRGTDELIPGTQSNNGIPGTLTRRFNRAGIFVYYCRLHAGLDIQNQPIAKPGESIENPPGNFGTPMMGIIFVQTPRASAQGSQSRPPRPSGQASSSSRSSSSVGAASIQETPTPRPTRTPYVY